MNQARQNDMQQRNATAVREFKKLLPGLTAFARALTGKRSLRVEMGPQSGTDGVKIIIRPPLALADSAVHERALCDQRDGNQLICPACARLEEVYMVIFHEVSHNVAGSMEEFDPDDMGPKAIQAAEKHGSPEFAAFIRERVASVRIYGTDSVYGYGNAISPYLLGFIRGIDDYRIDNASFIARPGVEEMNYHQTEIILNKGLEMGDGTFMTWRSRNVEEQIPIAILVGKQGHDLTDRFDPRIEQLFQMPVFEKLLETPVPDMLSVLYLSVAFLGELNKLGLYDLPLPPPPPMPMSSGDGEPEKGNEGDGDANDEDNEDGQGSGKAGSSSGKSSDDQEGEPDDTDDSEPAEDTSQKGEKDEQDAGSGHGSGNGNSDNSDPSGAEPGDNAGNGSGGNQDDESTASTSAGDESGSEKNDEGPGDTTSGNSSNSSVDDGESKDPVDGDTDSEGETNNGPSESRNNAHEHSDEESSDEDSTGDGNNEGNGDTYQPDGGETPEKESASGRDDDFDPRSESDADENGDQESEDSNPSAAEITGSTDQAPDFSDVDHASAEEIQDAMEHASGHAEAEVILGSKSSGSNYDIWPNDDGMEAAVTKALVFDDADTCVTGLKVHENGKRSAGWGANGRSRAKSFKPMELSELSPSILHARRVFSDSKMDKNVRNLKKGKLASAKLGARAWNPQDERLFQRKIRAKGIDDEVLIAMDLSGSTSSGWDRLIKRTAYGMAEVMSAVGVKFGIYGHTTDDAWGTYNFQQEIYVVKSANDPWGPVQKNLLAMLGGMEGSLDGHNMEFYRKVLMRSTAKRKTLVYFTDGQIPETNHSEEVLIIARELELYRQLGINILVVAFGTDGPKNYGLDTIKIKGAGDIVTVIKELESRLTH